MHTFVTSVMNWGEWSSSHPRHLNLMERTPQHLLDRLYGLDVVWPREKDHCLCRELNPNHQAHTVVTFLSELPCLLFGIMWCSREYGAMPWGTLLSHLNFNFFFFFRPKTLHHLKRSQVLTLLAWDHVTRTQTIALWSWRKYHVVWTILHTLTITSLSLARL